nr:MAG TPA: hypothetical protein [Caudoviricetes sp.]
MSFSSSSFISISISFYKNNSVSKILLIYGK